MNFAECEHLDAYVGGWLSDDRTVAFEAHLNDCAACREEIRRQRRIDRLLREGTRQLEPIPSALVDRIEGQLGVIRRRRAVGAAGGTACAAALLLGVGLWLTTAGYRTSPPLEVAVEKRPSPTADDRQPVPPQQPPAEVQPSTEIAMVDASTAIVVPLKTSDPNVSIVWIYPTVKPRPTEPAGRIP
jgi:anti-sigma factor RsiW